MKEKALEAKVISTLMDNGIYCFNHEPIVVNGLPLSVRGVPDIIGELNGRFFGIECKLDEKKYSQTPLQKIHEKMITYDGGLYYVVTPDNYKEILTSMIEESNDVTGVKIYGKKKREKFTK